MRTLIATFVSAASAATLLACGASSGSAADADAGVSLGGTTPEGGAAPDRGKPLVDGGYEGPDGSILRADRFVTQVVDFAPGDCAGFGIPQMPDVVLGPPVGAGDTQGGTDVVSLGVGGEIVLSFGTNAIVDGEGPDFIVFENAFYAAGDPSRPAADLGEVSVSEDGATWKAFPCAPGPKAPFGACAGWHPVYSAPGNGISPVDPKVAGGDVFDLADLGVTRARFVRIRDMKTTACDTKDKTTTSGFDLDAIAIVHASAP